MKEGIKMQSKNIEKVCEEIKKPIDCFNIKEMIINTTVPFEWADNIHPINQLGYFYFGIADGFKFNEEKVNKADELFLWKLYGLIQNYWLIHYIEWEKEN